MQKIEVVMSHNITNTSKSTVSLDSKNSTQFQVVPVSPKVLLTATLFQEANDYMKYYPSEVVQK
ncbi:unnamed protein product [Hymenolepis diminuta]|uniref:Uncharacterized protein n=1 Tax=Hymenolepis diminuta TaxID=6216 RepID=A0A564YJZ8_HYMDI|nr:unnamed protein product [Hymenolepis diminuta]